MPDRSTWPGCSTRSFLHNFCLALSMTDCKKCDNNNTLITTEATSTATAAATATRRPSVTQSMLLRSLCQLVDCARSRSPSLPLFLSWGALSRLLCDLAALAVGRALRALSLSLCAARPGPDDARTLCQASFPKQL